MKLECPQFQRFTSLFEVCLISSGVLNVWNGAAGPLSECRIRDSARYNPSLCAEWGGQNFSFICGMGRITCVALCAGHI